MKAIKSWAAFCLLCLSSTPLFALTISSGSTVTLGSLNMADNIIVEDNALLIINGNLTFGHPLNSTEYYIHIKNGGRVFSSSGSCTGLVVGATQKMWKGFIVEPTISSGPSTTTALHLHNFTISNARKAIELAGTIPGWVGKGQFISREVTIYNTLFINNEYHIMSGSGGYEFGASFFTDYNRDNGINHTRFIQCDFQQANTNWAIWLIKNRYILFDACTFNMGLAADMAIHYNSIRDSEMSHNTFLETRSLGIVYHGESTNIKMSNNTFAPPSTTLSTYTGIAVGHKINGGKIINSSITGNVFQGPGGSPSRNGIVVGDISTLGSTTGSATGLTIRDNEFVNLSVGTGLFNEQSGIPFVGVSKNSFSDCNTGLHVDRNASNTSVYCNTFSNCSSGFKITDDVGTSNVKDWTGKDPNNQFYSVGICINNLSPNTFAFYQSPLNPAPPYSFAGPILGSSTMLYNDCMGKSEDVSGTVIEDKLIQTVYPNPSNGQFTVKFEESCSRLLEIWDAAGRIVYSNNNDRDKMIIDISDQVSGVYTLRITSNDQVSMERIIIE